MTTLAYQQFFDSLSGLPVLMEGILMDIIREDSSTLKLIVAITGSGGHATGDVLECICESDSLFGSGVDWKTMDSRVAVFSTVKSVQPMRVYDVDGKGRFLSLTKVFNGTCTDILLY